MKKIRSIIFLFFILFTAGAAFAEPTGTGGYEFPLGSDAGDDLAVDGTKLVVEGDLGNVGIGTSTPTATLEVVGTIKASSWASSGMNIVDLTDVASATVTAGRMFIADGTDWESVAVSGDIAVSGAGAMTVTADTISLSDLSDVNTVTATGGRILVGDGTDFESVQMTGDCSLNAVGGINCSGINFFTDGGATTYLTSQTDDFAIGGTSLTASFSVDESVNTVRIGDASSSNGVLALYASDGDTGTLSFTTNDEFALEGGNVGIGTSNPAAALDVPDGWVRFHNIVIGTVGNATLVSGGGGGSYGLLNLQNTAAESYQMTSYPSTTADPVFFMDALPSGATERLWQLRKSGTTMVTVDNAGNVGIAMSTPQALLQVGSSGTLNNVGSGDVYIQNDLEVDGQIYPGLVGLSDVASATVTAGRMLVADGTDWESVAVSGDIAVSGAGAMTVTADTISLSDLSDVNTVTATGGRILVADGTDFESVAMTGDCTLNAIGGITCSGSGGWTDDGTVVRLTTSTDNVGIGTTGPASLLHVSAATNTTLKVTGVNADAQAFIHLLEQNGAAGIELEYDGAVGSSGQLNINDFGGASLVSINRGGNVGIGMTDPVVLLHVGSGGTLNNVGSGDVYIQNDLEVDGTLYAGSLSMGLVGLSDVASATVTAGRMLVADGTDWESVAVSGDIAVSGAGAMTVTADTISLSDLSDVNTVTATGGRILVGDGTDFESVAMTGDCSLNAIGGITCSAGASGWTDGGTSVYTTTSTDNVGIGTTASAALLDIQNTTTGIDLYLTNSDAGADGVTIHSYHNSVSPAAADTLTTINFDGESSTGVQRTYVQMKAFLDTATNTAEDAEFHLSAMENGTLKDMFRIVQDSSYTESAILMTLIFATPLVDSTGVVADNQTAVNHSAGTTYSGAVNAINIGNDTSGAFHAGLFGTGTSNADGWYALIGERMGGSNWDTAPGALSAGDYLPGVAFAGQSGASAGSDMEIGASIHGIVDGTVSAGVLPTAISFLTSTTDDTGLSQRMTIRSGGNVGIGITNPVVLLHVGSGGTLNNVGSGDVYIQNDLEVDGQIYPGLLGLSDVASATVTAGRMLIADGTDWESVAVSGDIAVSGAGAMTVSAESIQLSDLSDVNTVTATGGRILVGDGTDFESVAMTGDCSLNAIGGITCSATASGWTDDGTVVRLTTSTDNVGIGTTAPGAPLSFGSTAGEKILLFEDGTDKAGFGINTDELNIFGGNNNHISFRPTGGSTGTEYVTITVAGNVGIGTTAPEGLLEVQGVEATAAELFLDADDGDDVADTWIIRSAATNDLAFINGSTTNVTFKSGGNVGFGLSTPSAQVHVIDGDANSTVFPILIVTRDDSDSSGGIGLGAGMDYYIEESGSAYSQAGRTAMLWTNNITGNLDADFVVSLRDDNTVTEIMRVVGDTRSVGIGTTAPGQELEVNGDIRLDLNGAATTNGVCHSGANSDTTATDRDLVVCSGAPADIAEWYDTTGTEPGDLVVITGKTLTYEAPVVNAMTGELSSEKEKVTVSVLSKPESAYEAALIGVISTSPFQTFGRGVLENAKMPNPVALIGRVPVKVNLEGGEIKPGDVITSSSTPGVGMKATRPGRVIGVALSPLLRIESPQGYEKITLFINPHWFGGHDASAAIPGVGVESIQERLTLLEEQNMLLKAAFCREKPVDPLCQPTLAP